jgi:acyl carrier protein
MSRITREEIAKFLSETLFDGESVTFDEDLLLSGRLDSLGVMSLVAFLEEKIGTRIPAGDITIDHFESIETITDYLDGSAKT